MSPHPHAIAMDRRDSSVGEIIPIVFMIMSTSAMEKLAKLAPMGRETHVGSVERSNATSVSCGNYRTIYTDRSGANLIFSFKACLTFYDLRQLVEL